MDIHTTTIMDNIWPKKVKKLTTDQIIISDDWMEYWHKYIANTRIDKFNHGYVVSHSKLYSYATLEIGAGLGEHITYEKKFFPGIACSYAAIDLRCNMLKILAD